MFENIEFVNPELLALLLLIPAIAAWFFFKKKDPYVSLKMPTLESITELSSFRGSLRKYLPLLRVLAFAALVIALARPRQTLKEEDIKAEGIDICLVMDLSSSICLLYTSPSPRDLSTSRMPSSA